MPKTKAFQFALMAALFLSACGLRKPATPSPQPLPSPADNWTVQLIQSGGLIGVQLTVDVSSAGRLYVADQRAGRSVNQTLPPATIAQVRQLASSIRTPSNAPSSSACADCYVYDLEIRSDAGIISVHADDVTLKDSGAAALVALLQKLRDNALASQP